MERRRAAGALFALAACILCTAAAPTASEHTSLDLYNGGSEGCYYNFQHYGEGDRIMTNEPCLNCTCHNRMLMCYLRVCPFTKPIGQDCTVEKRGDQCCPIVTCPDVPVDLLTLTSTTSPAEYGATGVGKLDKYGCSINGKYFPEGSKVPPTPNKPCEHCYCIRNMTTCVMQECTLHVDGCTPIYLKDVCCPVRYTCDHPEDEILLLDDKTTTVRPTPGFLLTTTTNSPVTQFTQDCVHDDQIFSDGALIKTEKACEHCYCMKGDIVCVVQECGTPMENEGKNCTSLPPREGQCCPDTYICEGDEINTEYPMDLTTGLLIEEITTLSPPRRVGIEGSGYRKEPDNIGFLEPHPTEPTHEGSGDTHEAGQTVDENDVFTTEDDTKYIYSTVPSIEDVDKGDSEQATSMKPSVETPSSTDAYVSEADVKTTTTSDREPEITDKETAELDKIDTTTSSIPSYDHKLETSQPEVQSVTENEIDVHDEKITLTTIASTLEEKEDTTVQSYEENIVTDTLTTQHTKYVTITTPVPILEDEGITTESDREQQTISTGAIYEHSYEPGLHTASTTSAPFLEEVEGIPTGTYGQNFVTDGITESDIYDPTKNKTEVIMTPAAEDSDNLIDTNKYKDVESTKSPKLESHDISHSTTNVLILDDVQKTTTAFPVDLITSKSSEETHEGDIFIPTSTYQPTSAENEEKIIEENEIHKESPATTEIPEFLDPQNLDIETEKPQTEKYGRVTSEKTYDEHADISTTASVPITDLKEEEVIKASEEPVTVSSEAVGGEIVDADKHITITTSVPIHDDSLSTIENKDTHKPQVQDSDGSTKPVYAKDDEIATTQETSYDISTEKTFEQESYESQKPSSSTPVTEEFETTPTDFIKDQDFVTTPLVEQESLKPGDYVPSTSSTPFLEEIEKLTTEISQGHVVTDVIKEKDDLPPQQVVSATESSLLSETSDITTAEPDKGLSAIPNVIAEAEESTKTPVHEKTTQASDFKEEDKTYYEETSDKDIHTPDIATTITSSLPDDSIVKEDKVVATTEPSSRKEDEHHIEVEISKKPELVTEISVESYPTTESFEESHDIHKNVPSQDLTTETSRIEENTSEKEIKPDVEEEVTLTTQITPILPEMTTVNLGENEIDEDNILPPGRIPGEGDCLLNGVTYRNESVVPSTNKCHSDCRCVSSIINCSPIICSSPPEYMDNCQPTYDSPDSCCPTYVCDQFRETLPPMPHIQITTELPQQPSSTECRGDQCTIEEDKVQPSVSSELCANKDCGSKSDKKTETGSCGPHGCTDSSSKPELCSNGICTPASEDCANNDCKHPPATISLAGQCEGENCESSPVNLPHSPDCENGVCKDQKVPETIPVPVACTEEDGCKDTEVNVVQDCADDTCRRKETSDTQAKPPTSTCVGPHCEQQTPVQVAIETSTFGETFDIKTESPEHHVSYAGTTEAALHQTIAPEKQEINDYGTTISVQTTQKTSEISEFESDKETTSPVTQEEPKLPESMFINEEFVTETHTKSPELGSEHDIPTKIPEEYFTESNQIDTDAPQMPTERQPTLEISKSDDSERTEPSQYGPGTEEHTIKVITDEENPMKQQTTDASDEILATTSEAKLLESENYTTKQPEHSISEVTEAQVTESQERTTIPEISVVEHDEYTQVPMYTVPKSEDVTIQPAVVTAEEITTEYQSVPEYQSEPKTTTLTPTDLYITVKETDESVTESKIQKVDDELYTHSHVSATETQAITLESSTQENTEAYLPDVTIGSEEHALPTESSGVIIDHDLKATDKTTYVTEENHIPSATDKIQETEKDHVTGTEMPEVSLTETADSTSEPSIKEHEESATEVQKETNVDSTSPSIVHFDETTEGIIREHEVTESSPSVPHNIEEETPAVTLSYDTSTETSEVLATTDLDRITAKPHDIEQESTQTEKSETSSHETELVTDILMEHVTMPEQTTNLPEILSHKKDHSSESPVVLESETEKSSVAEGITTIKQEEPSTDKVLTTVAAESEAQTGKPETLTEESYPPIIKDKTTDTEIIKEKTEIPLIPQEMSTEDISENDLEKSTEHGDTFTARPESLETEVYIPVKAEQTTILTPIGKDTTSDLLEGIPVTDKYEDDIKIDQVETSTDKEVSEYTSPQSYAPVTQKPKISYTQTISPDFTTKNIETFTTEQSEVLTDMSTLAAPVIDTVVTEKAPDIKEVEVPEIHETTVISVVDITKHDEVTTETAEKYNIEEDLGTKTQDGVTQQQEFTTHIPEIHASTSSDLSSSIAPEIIPETLVTEPQDISKVSDEIQVTESQSPVTDFEHPLITELPEIQEPVKSTENLTSTDAPKSPTEATKAQSGHTESPDLDATTVDTLSTDREEITLSSTAPHLTEIDAGGVTESPDKVTTLPESSSIKSEETSTSLASDEFSEHGGSQTISSVPLTEEPVEATSQIPDSEKDEHEDTATPEPIANVDIITPFDETHTVPQETPTEKISVELSTEPALPIASESHDKNELTESTSVPMYELPETTPYLIELQEHTHKNIQEVTTSAPIEEERTTEQTVPGVIEHEHTVPKITTEHIVDKETEIQETTKHYEEMPLEISETPTQPTISEESIPTTQSAEIDIKETTTYKDRDFTTSSPTKGIEIEKESTPEVTVTDNVEKIITSEKPIQSDLTVEITTPEEINILSTEKSTTAIAEELPTQAPVSVDKITKPEEKPSSLPPLLPDLSKPGPSDIQPTDEVPSPYEEAHFPSSGSSGYGNEPDYVEEDQQFSQNSPGTCRYGGKVYVSAQQIPRDDPCDFCFCFRSDIICLQQSCPPPIHGCHEEPIQGFCCPRYECPVSMATTLNVTTTTTTTTTTLPPHFPTHSYKGAAQRRGCQIKGHTYKVGEVVRGSSGPCLHCTCGGDGQMKCDPKACTPEPMLRQMIAAAVSAKRRR